MDTKDELTKQMMILKLDLKSGVEIQENKCIILPTGIESETIFIKALKSGEQMVIYYRQRQYNHQHIRKERHWIEVIAHKKLLQIHIVNGETTEDAIEYICTNTGANVMIYEFLDN